MVAAREVDKPFARLVLNVRRVHDDESPAGQANAGDVVQHVERIFGRRLVVLVIGNDAAACIRRDDFGGKEVLFRERRLS